MASGLGGSYSKRIRPGRATHICPVLGPFFAFCWNRAVIVLMLFRYEAIRCNASVSCGVSVACTGAAAFAANGSISSNATSPQRRDLDSDFMRDVTLSPTPVIPLKGMPASAPHVNARSDAASTAKISGAAERTLAWLGPRAFSPRFDPAGKAEPDACRGGRAPNGG